MKTAVSDESELIDAARGGSVSAFTELVESYRNGLLRFLLTRCATYADAEDALQDTLISAYRYLYSYDPRWRFSTWIYRIAVRNAAKLRPLPTAELGDVAAGTPDPLEQCIAASERENLWISARRLLSREVYAAMWLRYVEDMSIKDVARVLDRTPSWTKVNLLRGRRALDAELNPRRAGEDKAYG